jgi:vacuolar-type H+-ATPase subunit E/Vma4
MSLESLVEEIRRHGEADESAILARTAEATARLAEDRDRQIAELRAQAKKATEAEVARERAQRLAAAKLKARKALYEAREARLSGAIAETRGLLQQYTRTAAYPAVLKRMVQAANDELGAKIRISGRAEDAALLQKVAGKSFDPTPRAILGGLVAETADGNRRLNLSFDELLRLREDKVRELLA